MTKRVAEPGHQHSAPDHASQAVEPIPVLRLDTARRTDGTFDERFIAGLRTAVHEIGFLQPTGYGDARADRRADRSVPAARRTEPVA
jgi:hypothetical protein